MPRRVYEYAIDSLALPGLKKHSVDVKIRLRADKYIPIGDRRHGELRCRARQIRRSALAAVVQLNHT